MLFKQPSFNSLFLLLSFHNSFSALHCVSTLFKFSCIVVLQRQNKKAINQTKLMIMKKMLFLLAAAFQFCMIGCQKKSDDTEAPAKSVRTPKTTVPDELVGRWAITSISGSSVFNIPSGTTYNTSEAFLGYTINKNGTIQEHGYISTYQYGASTWTKWNINGSVELNGDAITFHRDKGTYTASTFSGEKQFGPAEVYPNKSSRYEDWEIGLDSRGQTALFVLHDDGSVQTYVKQ